MVQTAEISEELSGWMPEPASLQVCGVFSSAVYLTGKTGRMLLLHDCCYGLIPFGIGIRNISCFLQEGRILVGQKAILREQMLELPEADICLKLQKRRIESKAAVLPSKQEFEAAVTKGKLCLLKYGNGLAFYLWPEVSEGIPDPEDLFARAALPSLRKLQLAMETESLKHMEEALRGLLGLGRGLTPSLDDFLTGLIYTLHFAEKHWKIQLPETKLLAQSIYSLAAERTNPFSAAYLQASGAGYFFSCLDHVLQSDGKVQSNEQMQSDGQILSEKAVLELLRVGSSSGSDMLAGVIFGLQHIDRRKQE